MNSYNQHSDNEIELGRFGAYLLKSKIVAEKYAPYYVSWVRKFLAAPVTGRRLEDQIIAFIAHRIKP